MNITLQLQLQHFVTLKTGAAELTERLLIKSIRSTYKI